MMKIFIKSLTESLLTNKHKEFNTHRLKFDFSYSFLLYFLFYKDHRYKENIKKIEY